MEINLNGKTIVITGSSRGIGLELAKRFAKEGANVVINYFQSEEKAKELFAEISTLNQNCLLLKADIRNSCEVEIFYRKCIEKYKKIDVLINNAGMSADNLLPMMTEKQWCDVIDLNLKGVFFCSKFFSKNMIKNNSGKIINIASLAGQLGYEGQTNYSASKAGVIGFTKALAKELGKFNIYVNAICPGLIFTDLNNDCKEKIINHRDISVLNDFDYLNCLTDFLIFMASDCFHSISGQVFNLDARLL